MYHPKPPGVPGFSDLLHQGKYNVLDNTQSTDSGTRAFNFPF